MRAADTLDQCMCETRLRMCEVYPQCVYTRKMCVQLVRVCTPSVAHTVDATTWVRTPVGTTPTTKNQRKKKTSSFHYHLEGIPSDFLQGSLMLLSFPRHALFLILDDACVWNFESQFWFTANCHFQLRESVCTTFPSYSSLRVHTSPSYSLEFHVGVCNESL